LDIGVVYDTPYTVFNTINILTIICLFIKFLGFVLYSEDNIGVKTIVPKVENIERNWYLIDAQDQILGRLASQIAFLLRGKHKPEFSPHLDLGDHVIVINADKIAVTGRKLEQKEYTKYTGYPSGLRKKKLGKLIHDRPEWVIMHAVKGMLPKNRLGRKMIKKLRIYSGSEHPHQAQRPEVLPDELRRI
jgi:large subunit ribosomal protein L13